MVSLRSRKLVDDLTHVRAASTNLRVEVPMEMVHEYVDAGRPIDHFMVQQQGAVQALTTEMQSKRNAFRCVSDCIRERAGDLLGESQPPDRR